MNGAGIVTTLAVLTSVYLLSCLVWPWRKCPACDSGKRRFGSVWRTCPRCGGTGKRKRIGARLFDMVTGGGS